MLFMGPRQKDFDIAQDTSLHRNDSRGCRPYKIIMRPCLRDLSFPMVRSLPYKFHRCADSICLNGKVYLRTLVGSHNFLILATDSEAIPSHSGSLFFSTPSFKSSI